MLHIPMVARVRAARDQSPPPPGVVRGSEPVHCDVAPAAGATAAMVRGSTEPSLLSSCTEDAPACGQPPADASEREADISEDSSRLERPEATSLAGPTLHNPMCMLGQEALLGSAEQLPATTDPAGETAAERSPEHPRHGLEKVFAALVPYGESSADTGAHSDGDDEGGEQADDGTPVLQEPRQTPAVDVHGHSARLDRPACPVSGSELANAADNDNAGGNTATLALEHDTAPATTGGDVGQAPTASADGLAEHGPAADSPAAPASPLAGLLQHADATDPMRTSVPPADEIRARLAALEAAAGPLLASAPADRLPPEALAEASREGSPEPEPLAVPPIGEHGESDDAMQAELACGVRAHAGPGGATWGPTNRPKRTAGGDPMEVRMASAHKYCNYLQHACVLCLECQVSADLHSLLASFLACPCFMPACMLRGCNCCLLAKHRAGLPSVDTHGLLLPQNRTVRYLVHAIRSNSQEFEACGRVLRLKQYLGINVRPPVMDAILTALEENTLVEALYIQNFEEVRQSVTSMTVLLTSESGVASGPGAVLAVPCSDVACRQSETLAVQNLRAP